MQYRAELLLTTTLDKRKINTKIAFRRNIFGENSSLGKVGFEKFGRPRGRIDKGS